MSSRRRAWDRHAIKAEIYRRGQTLVGLSRTHGFHPHDCGVALLRPYPKVDPVIADFLGVPLHELWPDRYDRAGQRLNSSKYPSKPTQFCTSQKGRAA